MEQNKDLIKSLEVKIKLLEIENQKLASTIELNNKEINQIKSIISSLSENNSTPLGEPMPTLTHNPEDKIIDLKFGWKINDNARSTNDLKTVRKVAGGTKWNCSAVGDKSLIKGKINRWKIQLSRLTGSIVLGIIPKDINLNSIDNWKKGYITCSSNFGKHNLGVYTDFANHKATEGNILEVIANLDIGELSFLINGNNLGVFCNNIIKDIEYFPFIDIDTEETEITLF